MKILKYQLLSSAVFIICIALMFLSWFGGSRGVQEISGTIVLYHPVTILAIAISAIGIWFCNHRFGMVCGILGPCLLLGMELFYFLTWHIETVTGEFSLVSSFSLTYPEFYFGIAATLALLAANLVCMKKSLIHK